MNVESAEAPSEIARARLGVVDCLERNELRVPGCVRALLSFYSSFLLNSWLAPAGVYCAADS